jgi:hypothetical protein
MRDKRIPAGDIYVSLIVEKLKGLTLTGIQCSFILETLHACIAESEYIEHGSIDLDDIAAKMYMEVKNYEQTN